MRHRLSLSACLALLSAWLGIPGSVAAQPIAQVSRQIVADHDYDSATPTYCVLEPNRRQGAGTVSTSGSSTTLTASVTTAFTNVGAGAAITIDRGPVNGTVVGYVFGAPADGDTLTMRTAITVGAGSSWFYQNLNCGTGAGSGWFGVGDVTPSRTWHVDIDQIALASGSLAMRLMCKSASPYQTTGVQVYPETGAAGSECATGLFTAAAHCAFVDNDIRFSQCRWYVTLTDDAGDTGANSERVSISVAGSVE